MDIPTLDNQARRELRQLGVGLVLVFGSAVTGNRHPGSDVDIGIVFSDQTMKQRDPVEVYGSLQDVFSKLFPGQKIDIVYLQEAPLSLQFRAISEGRELFTVSPVFVADYREYVMKRYFDFIPVEQEFAQALLGAT